MDNYVSHPTLGRVDMGPFFMDILSYSFAFMDTCSRILIVTKKQSLSSITLIVLSYVMKGL